jgi:nitrate/nitrite transporter NarK
MTCADYYAGKPPVTSNTTSPYSRCEIRPVDTATASQISILAITNTITGVVNLFVLGWMIKRFGPWFTLLVQTLFSAVRIAVNILGISIGSRTGIVLMQSAQFLGIVGRPGGVT